MSRSKKNTAKREIADRINLAAFLSVALWGGPVYSAEWSIEPSVSIRGMYDDNIRLTRDAHESVAGLWLSPQIKLSYESEVALVSGSGALNAQRYRPDRGLDTTDTLLHLTGRRKYETGSYGLTLDYVRDTTLQSELQQTGQVQVRTPRRSVNLTPDWMLRLTERFDAVAGYQYSDVTYDNASSFGLFDYRYHTVYSMLQYKLSPLDEASATLSYSRYDPSESTLRLNDATVRFAYKRAFSETLRGLVSVGVTHLSGPGTPTGATNRAIGNASLDRQYESGLLGFRLSRELQPSASGSLALVNRAAVETSLRPRETVTLFLDAAIYRTQYVSFVPTSGESTYFQVEPRVSLLLTRDWSVQAGYNYRHLKYRTEPSAAVGNVVYVSFIYNWPKLALSQ